LTTLTLFSVPKPFRGHIGIIQRNAIQSWKLLRPLPEIILFGKDEGVADAAQQFAVRHVPDVACNEYGTPLLNDLFASAQRLASHGLLCYVNADIILMRDFAEAVRRLDRRRRRFLMIGQRWDTDLCQHLDCTGDWESRLRSYAVSQGTLHPPTGVDYFVFPRETGWEIPPFAIGRTVWDNWLIYRARALGFSVIDATEAVMAIHQNHDYRHLPPEAGDAWKGPEARRNLELSGGGEYRFTLEDVTHKLTPSKLTLALEQKYLERHLETLPRLYPRLAPLAVIAVKALIRAQGLKRIPAASETNR
jgi:hypothetical protein